MPSVSNMAKDLVGSEIIRLATQINEKIKNGQSIYNLTIGDFNPEIFPIPDRFKELIIEAYEKGYTNYPQANGMEILREAISQHLNINANLNYDLDEIMVSCGSRPLIYAIYRTILDPKDKVIYPVPSWNNNHYSHLNYAQQLQVQTKAENNFMPSVDELKEYIEDAAMIALCSPLNPTGTVFSKTQLGGICEMVLEENRKRSLTGKKPLYVLYDEIYWLLTHGETEHFNPVTLYPEMKEYTILVDGMSKAFAATGVRLGWATGPKYIINKMKAIISHVGAWSAKAEQMAAAQYLNEQTSVNEYLDDFKSEVYYRLDNFYKGFKSLKDKGFPVDAIKPQAAIYLTVYIDLIGKRTEKGETLKSIQEVYSYLLNEANTALVPFYCFGAGKDVPWFRLSVGTCKKEDISLILSNIENALSKVH
ncbi:MAG TPA: aminotransferase class I/II-fold pyridoxal phosphate-dependent enzyme [Bacteroidetes bacterium]|nr:aminotransferase class I/II-fold pyridoxal phosphate-dependent enzyme [Bacteroidota bacterium]